jgi:Skp family chaperone for outer membrane proteins
MFQHPKFDEASKILIFFSRSIEGNLALVLEGEKDLERRQMIMNYSAQVSEFAEMDRAIAAEQDPEKKERLWESRQKKLSDFEASLMGPIMQECRQAIQAVMVLKKMTVVIELDSVYYGGTDITEDVIQRLKRQ